MGKCTDCGTNFVSSPEQPAADALCKYCEIAQLKADNAKLRKALVGFVGADTEEELKGMEILIQNSTHSAEERMIAVTAIRVLRETL